MGGYSYDFGGYAYDFIKSEIFGKPCAIVDAQFLSFSIDRSELFLNAR